MVVTRYKGSVLELCLDCMSMLPRVGELTVTKLVAYSFFFKKI
jgi:hypothetical protein